jgi:hypothetical protein
MDYVLLLRLIAAVALTSSIAVEVGRHATAEAEPLEGFELPPAHTDATPPDPDR